MHIGVQRSWYKAHFTKEIVLWRIAVCSGALSHVSVHEMSTVGTSKVKSGGGEVALQVCDCSDIVIIGRLSGVDGEVPSVSRSSP